MTITQRGAWVVRDNVLPYYASVARSRAWRAMEHALLSGTWQRRACVFERPGYYTLYLTVIADPSGTVCVWLDTDALPEEDAEWQAAHRVACSLERYYLRCRLDNATREAIATAADRQAFVTGLLESLKIPR